DVTVLEASNRTGGHVRTVREGLAEGLYVDAGAEHFTQPGYDRYWQYVQEFNLTALPYPRRNRIMRVLQGKMYAEDDLQSPNVLNVPLFPPQVYRRMGGNQLMTDTFGLRLGERVRLETPVTSIEHGSSGGRVHYRESGEEKTLEAEFLVCCMSAIMLRQIPVIPSWPESKRYALASVPYYTASRPFFQSRSRFWEKDSVSPNIEFNERALNHIWRMADDVDTRRGLLVGTADALTTGDVALKTFRQYYPGKSEDIEQALVFDWSRQPWVMACETLHYPPGDLTRLWPALVEPHGRIHFAGAY